MIVYQAALRNRFFPETVRPWVPIQLGRGLAVFFGLMFFVGIMSSNYDWSKTALQYLILCEGLVWCLYGAVLWNRAGARLAIGVFLFTLGSVAFTHELYSQMAVPAYRNALDLGLNFGIIVSSIGVLEGRDSARFWAIGLVLFQNVGKQVLFVTYALAAGRGTISAMSVGRLAVGLILSLVVGYALTHPKIKAQFAAKSV